MGVLPGDGNHQPQVGFNHPVAGTAGFGRTAGQAAVKFADHRNRQTSFPFDGAEFLGGQPILMVGVAGFQSINPPGQLRATGRSTQPRPWAPAETAGRDHWPAGAGFASGDLQTEGVQTGQRLLMQNTQLGKMTGGCLGIRAGFSIVQRFSLLLVVCVIHDGLAGVHRHVRVIRSQQSLHIHQQRRGFLDIPKAADHLGQARSMVTDAIVVPQQLTTAGG